MEEAIASHFSVDLTKTLKSDVNFNEMDLITCFLTILVRKMD